MTSRLVKYGGGLILILMLIAIFGTAIMLWDKSHLKTNISEDNKSIALPSVGGERESRQRLKSRIHFKSFANNRWLQDDFDSSRDGAEFLMLANWETPQSDDKGLYKSRLQRSYVNCQDRTILILLTRDYSQAFAQGHVVNTSGPDPEGAFKASAQSPLAGDIVRVVCDYTNQSRKTLFESLKAPSFDWAVDSDL